MVAMDILKTSKVAKIVVSAAAGCAAGAGMYFLSTLIKNKLDERKESEWNELDYPDIPEGINVETEGGDDAEELADEDDDVPFHEDRVVSPKYDKPDIVDYTRYSKLVESCIEDLSKKEPEILDDEEENPACSMISEVEYLDASNKFAKADGTYFTQDELLAGWNDDLVVRDIFSTVGWKAIRTFDDPSVKSVYVRNSELKVDYEIVRCDDLFEEVVHETVMATPED